MSDLFDDPAPGQNAPEFSVSELSGAIKKAVEQGFSHIRVRGEVGRVSRPASGHIYLDLKDDRAVLAGVIWKGTAQRLRTPPEAGMEVVATGRLTTFPGQSRYQIVIEDIAPAGVGALMAMLEKRRAALKAEGLFDEDRKRPLPFLPEVIGVVTSPSGAVIRDILHRLRDRFPRKVLVWPVVVQGERCAPEVAEAIRGFNALEHGGAMPRPDVLIVARGGGSIEDLWGFNEEIVVRATAESEIPLISAVGHETDTTLIDFAADRRAPTPTAAAEMAVPVRVDLAADLAALEERRLRAMAQGLTGRQQRLRDLSRALPRADALLGERRQRLDAASQRLPLALAGFLQSRRLGLVSGPAGRFGPQQLVARLTLEQSKVTGAAQRLSAGLSRQTERRRAQLSSLILRPQALVQRQQDAAAQVSQLARGLGRAAAHILRDQRQRLGNLDRMLNTLGYTETLRRGYAVVRTAPGGALVSNRKVAAQASSLEIEFADGRLNVGVSAPRSRVKPKNPEDDGGPQGVLF
ncbi:MAG: exodeoxyribonuclease VII large subunit [Pseudomonadota bacterium]